MKAPGFWYQQNGLASFILSPLSAVYTMAGRRHREKSQPKTLSIPVICLGNIVSGGSGKTPTALALLDLFQNEKIALSPFFLTRGYRGEIEGPERVDNSHDPALWGDEALLLSRHAPTIVSKNRYAGGVLAQDLQADLIIMDDGMQNYTLTKNITFCVIDGPTGFGNGSVLPLGPLRQPLQDGFNLSDAFIVIGEDKTSAITKLPKEKPVFKAALKIKQDHKLSKDTPYIAFCGIGYPDKFKASLSEAGLTIKDFKSFGDHHTYSPKDIAELSNLAAAQNARLITTEKDFARLPDFFQKDLIDVLPVEIVFENPDTIVTFVKNRIKP